MQHNLTYVLSIAGFDPSAGAGILADVKTFGQIGVYGLGVCSAITIQNEDHFEDVKWIHVKDIFSQLEILLKRYPVSFIKIGLIESFNVMGEILNLLKKNFPSKKIIWDPILRASAGFEFHDLFDPIQFMNICKEIFLITPNTEEIKRLMDEEDALIAARKLRGTTNVFLKSYVDENKKMSDVLIANDEEFFFETEIIPGLGKHGSGCVLSSAITGFLAKGNDMRTSCLLAKEYTLEFLKSTDSLLGDHRNINIDLSSSAAKSFRS